MKANAKKREMLLPEPLTREITLCEDRLIELVVGEPKFLQIVTVRHGQPFDLKGVPVRDFVHQEGGALCSQECSWCEDVRLRIKV